ncbi:MAG: signal peptidase II [Acidimicrobiales bacterium]
MVGVAAVVIALDQVTKSLAVRGLSRHPVHLIGPFYLALSYNTGVAFSIGSGLTLPIVLIAIALVVIVPWFARGVPTLPAAVAVGLIVGGALGNLADRIFRHHHGGVVDFLYSGFWPTFNVADASIVCGSILLCVAMFQAGRRLPRSPGGTEPGGGEVGEAPRSDGRDGAPSPDRGRR